MSLIVAARYDTFDDAGAATQYLARHGFTEDRVHNFYVNSAGAHDRYPVGGDRRNDPDARGGVGGVLGGAAALGLVAAAVAMLTVNRFEYSSLIVIAAGGVGAYVGALAGAMLAVGRRRRHAASSAPEERLNSEGHPAIRLAGVLLALQVTPEQEGEAIRLLRETGGYDVERANGRWEGGRWRDFDPLKPPQPVSVTEPAHVHIA
ncbi:hypothetical protein [Bordetella sp. 02P26C-1]|uniref:hypothetical protein n=1 Tax=Bordetella sp. 02P26C-1 TaxID=2683195 RepID=UPI0013552B89|nr:hypothetical protein [Bordetella sp. 02P26C-1]MVW79842.1 hypothetical protein [Bordetella sp. 02P26C-1]